MSAFKNIIFSKLPQYTRMYRHLQQLLQVRTIKKWKNLLRAELARLNGDTVLNSLPYIFIIDTGDICNLRCPLCPTGNKDISSPQGFMALNTFKGIIDKAKDYGIEVILHNWGEPFLNKDIFQMIQYANNAKLGTSMSSNFNTVDEHDVHRLVESRLDHLTISLDACTENTYKVYRRNGNIRTVIKNLESLQSYKKKMRTKRPFIEWQFLVMKHNEHEIAGAMKLASKLGVEHFRCISAGLPFYKMEDSSMAEEWISTLPEYKSYHPEKIKKDGFLYNERCFYLYRSISIEKDGSVVPCCAVYNVDNKFGNILTDDLMSIWNNSCYSSARSLFSKKIFDHKNKTVCSKCKIFRKAVV